MDQRLALLRFKRGTGLLERIRAALEPELKVISTRSRPWPRSLMMVVRFKNGTLRPRAVVITHETEYSYDENDLPE